MDTFIRGNLDAKLPQQSLIYLIVCLSGVLVFILLGIIPAQRRLAGLERKIGEERLRLEEQSTLLPVYDILKQRIHRREWILPFPQKAELPQEQLDQLGEKVNEIANQAGVAIVSYFPVVNSLASGSQSLAAEAALKGDFFSFRKFLTGLGGIACVTHIEEILMEQHPDGLEMKLKFWIALS